MNGESRNPESVSESAELPAAPSTPGRGVLGTQSRRHALKLMAVTTLSGGLPGHPSALAADARVSRLSTDDLELLDSLERTALRYFQEAAHPETGLVLDRKRADGEHDSRTVASIAATGFGLSTLCIGAQRGHARRESLRLQVLRTLRWLATEQPHEKGFYYHFHDWATGRRVWSCELSSVDTAILLCGVIHARSVFGEDPEVQRLADLLIDRVDWSWVLGGQDTVSMGWKPESGFLTARWDHYSELLMIYLLGIGAEKNRLPVETWRAWTRPVREYEGERFIWTPAPLFAHQFSHAWFDFRGWLDRGVDWFQNSKAASRAHHRWCQSMRRRFPFWSEDFWGVSSSDSEKGYVGWGGPPENGPLDGTLVPCASAGSLPFLPAECLRTLHAQRRWTRTRIWRRYGFVDAWNPHSGWVNPDVVGIDVGISALMAANLRDGLVWRAFGADELVRRGMRRVRAG